MSGIIKLIGFLKVSNKTINATIEIINTKIKFKELNLLPSLCLYETVKDITLFIQDLF